MTDENRIAYLEAQIETTALGRDNARVMLAEVGKENGRLRANVSVLSQAVADHRVELARLVAIEKAARELLVHLRYVDELRSYVLRRDEAYGALEAALSPSPSTPRAYPEGKECRCPPGYACGKYINRRATPRGDR